MKNTYNKRSQEIENESPNSPPRAPKKRVDVISWRNERKNLNQPLHQKETTCINITITVQEPEDRSTPSNPGYEHFGVPPEIKHVD